MSSIADTTELAHDLRGLVADLAELDADDLDLDTPFSEAGIDSLMAMEIAVHVERREAVRFRDTDLTRIRTLRQLAELVVERRDG